MYALNEKKSVLDNRQKIKRTYLVYVLFSICNRQTALFCLICFVFSGENIKCTGQVRVESKKQHYWLCCFLYATGLLPVIFLNMRLKWLKLSYAILLLISKGLESVCRKRVQA